MWQTDRSAVRTQVDKASTIRTGDGVPLDVVIENLSHSGFKIECLANLAVGEEIALGLAGVGVRAAIVLWSNGSTAGCRFNDPISQAEMEATIAASTVIDASNVWGPLPSENAAVPQRRYSTRRKLALVLAATLAAWVFWSAVAIAFWQIVRAFI
ncbi:MAG TPA: PilZ domain-containing protein [Sphingobium sp.]|uniref:PilZ domain-containing protein n=1 Tax=Sphingobium sp. TaxID=1912891 RepID=UPI002ED16712